MGAQYILDTNAALYCWINPDKLGTHARTIIENPTIQLHLTQISIWEICLKYRIGKLKLPDSPETYLPKRILQSDFKLLQLEDRFLYHMAKLPNHHQDPFDHLIISTASCMDLPVLTSDKMFEKYPIEVIW